MRALKRAVFEAAICKGTVCVHIDAAEGLEAPVSVPCMLEYGLDQVRPIPDLDIGPLGIRATLSFQCEPVGTFVPWDAVVAMVMRSPAFVAQWPRLVEAGPPVEKRAGLRAV